VSSSVFHEPWWLDAVAPGDWAEVRVVEDGRTVARLPHVPRSRYGLRLVVAPPLTNRLGPLLDPAVESGRNETRIRRFDALVHGLIDALPRADLTRIPLHPDLLSWLPFQRRGFVVEPQLSYVIDRLEDLDEVWAGVAGRTRRVVKAARRTVEVRRDTDAVELRRLVGATYARQGLGLPYDAGVLDRVVRAAVERERGTVVTAVDQEGRCHASLFSVWDDRRAWYVCGGGDPALRRSGAGTLLMWELIREAAKRTERFDFEGSMVPGVERYFRNFGGRRETYHLATRVGPRAAPFWTARQAAARWRERRGRDDQPSDTGT
jgi:Acetyltransferase (GNAT) domain